MARPDLFAPARRGMVHAKEALLRRSTYRLLAQITTEAARDPAERRAHQWQALSEVVRQASAHVPYYRERWGALDLEQALQSPSSFAEQVPLLSREGLRLAGQSLVSELGHRRMTRGSTSGSSGHFLQFYSDPVRGGLSAAARLHARRRLGLTEGMREYRMMGRAWFEPVGWRAFFDNRLQWWASRLTGTVKGNAFSGGDDDLAVRCAEIARFRPAIMSGYGGSLLTLADYVLRARRQADVASVRAVIFASEPVYETGRDLLSQAFGAQVYTDYVCHEMGLIAHECSAGNLHLNDDYCYAETVDDQGRLVSGAPGRLVLTDLLCSRTPFVRYALGDVAELAHSDARCPCGAAQRMLKRFIGRADDRILRPDGSYLHPFALDYLMVHLDQVRHWQTRLSPPNRLRMLIEVAPEVLAQTQSMMLAQLEHYAGPGFVCSIEAVEQIAPEPTGKYARVVREPGWPPSTR